MGDSAIAAWGAVLDRSVEQIAAASQDARTFDRQLIAQVSDVWDNNTYSFVGSAIDRGVRREQHAVAALGWLADFGGERRAWVLEQLRISGHDIELPAASYPEDVYRRDFAGRVLSPQEPLTADVAARIRNDYDLTTAAVRALTVERSGAGLRGSLQLQLERRLALDEFDGAGIPPAELDLRFDGITDVSFDLDDCHGLTVDQEVALTIGRNGLLRASRGTAWIHDPRWHLSSAGRAADARTSAEIWRPDPPPRTGRRLEGAARVAAAVLHWAMLEIRMVRYPQHAHRAPVYRIAQVLAGAGSAIVAAGARRWGREAAFRSLIEGWIAAGGDQLAGVFRYVLLDLAKDEFEPAAVRRLARADP
ncbi:hypothetical protein [Kribbella sp. HUAS MG21]|uniref:Uncharacterized protein n=1 Tax=Kribbella sp. HUAS MG21 TaxID=3160966 RepID=A0AAU7TGA0_9ACTN